MIILTPKNCIIKLLAEIPLGVFYRPPNSDLKPLQDIQNALDAINSNNIVLLGDFNLSDLDWSHHTLLLDIVQDNFLHQLVQEPTRNQNILDLVLTNNVDLINNIAVGEPFSDHNLRSFLSIALRILSAHHFARN